MMSKWIDAPALAAGDGLGEIAARYPLAARLLARRGICREAEAHAFLDPDDYRPTSPFDLPGMEAGVERICKSIQAGERIGVWGDFDVDGLTAAAILVGGLRSAGADVVYHIPVRARASHGVHLPALEELIRGGVRLLVTCDTGIDAHEQTVYAQENGLDVVISDHHRLPERLPPAQAVINPRLLPPEHPFNSLPGAGVAFEIVAGLAERGLAGIDAQGFHDLAALAVVADVVPVLSEARWLLQRGLRTLRSAPRPALQAMYDLIDLDPAHITEEHIAFLLAPRLNAVGRLEDAGSLVEFLLSEDGAFIEPIAAEMEALNARRRLLSQEVFDSAISLIDRSPALLDAPLLILSHETWQAGVIGIVAGRLAQTCGRPVVLISIDPQSGIGRGSARSVAGVDIAAAIAGQAHLLKAHGGHPAAAGFSLPSHLIEDFRRGLSRTVADMVAGRDLEPVLMIDNYLSLGDLNLELAGEVEMLAPFGPGNPAPLFASRHLGLSSVTPIGRGQEHLKMRVDDGKGNTRDVFWWQGAGQPLPPAPFDLAYSLRANTYQGQRGLQVVWIEARPSETDAVHIPESGRQAFEIVDLRRHSDPLLVLEGILTAQTEDVEIWCEGERRPAIPSAANICHKRSDLRPAGLLVIWNPPPAREVLLAAVAVVQPRRVCLLPSPREDLEAAHFLRWLAGYVKSALKSNAGSINLKILAALTGETEAAVRLGVAWLAARGDIDLSADNSPDADEIVVSTAEGKNGDRDTSARLLKRIDAALAESAAYREYFRHADANVLF